MTESVEIRPYFAQGERYPSLVGVRVGGDEYEMAYVSKAELMSVMDENTKLRELARDMWTGINRAYVSGRSLEPYQFEMCLRELGIEVN